MSLITQKRDKLVLTIHINCYGIRQLMSVTSFNYCTGFACFGPIVRSSEARMTHIADVFINRQTRQTKSMLQTQIYPVLHTRSIRKEM
jgi:hypothetical protein